MQLLPISNVAGQLKPGMPLPWGVRDASGKLLLARGQMVSDVSMVQALLDRGTYVDADEARNANGGSRSGATTRKENFLGRWQAIQARLHTVLHTPPAGLGQALGEVISVLIGLADKWPDKMLFQILRQDQSKLQSYGAWHSLHTAAICSLTSRRMGWTEPRRRSLVGAALSMNLSMVELQGKLALQTHRPSEEQWVDIKAHPTQSHRMLVDGGVDDPEWLQAVIEHHESPDGKGYPGGLTEPCEMAQLLHYVDVFAAKISARATRGAMPPNQAAREIFTQNQGHPLAAALIKEFGIYPPGCFVKLISGETAVVVQRGQNANTPIAASLTNRNGQPLAEVIQRDTSQKDYAVVSVVPEANVMVRVSFEKLYKDE